MNIINTDLLIEKVDSFLSPFGIDSDFDSDFYYDPEEERVYFSILVTEKADALFKKFILENFNLITPNIFTLSLLHEVGHFYTLNFFTEKQIRNTHKEKVLIEKKLNTLPINSDEYNEVFCEYFNLNIEKVATEWAVTYYKNNKKRCDDFYEDFLNILQNEYIILELTE